MTPTTFLSIPGGLLTTGFSDRRARKKNLIRQYTTCDTALKNTSNPEWMRLPPMCRLTHDELERWAGRNVSGGRITGARRFNRDDWRAVGSADRIWVDRLVAAGWAEWHGDDLLLLGTDLDGEQGFIDRLAEKKLQGKLDNAKRRGRSADAVDGKIAPRQMAETSHFEDRAPAPASIRSDLRSPPQGQELVPPPPPPTARMGGGGGRPNGRGEGRNGSLITDDRERADYLAWLALYGKRPLPKETADTERAWLELDMPPGGAAVRACMEFTRRELGKGENQRQEGRFKVKPVVFLEGKWGPELSRRRKNQEKKKNGHHPETSENLVGQVLGQWGVEA